MDQRAWVIEDTSTLTINVKSPSIARYWKDGTNQDELHFRTMLAEIATNVVARHIIQHRSRQERRDSSDILSEHMRLMDKWLPQVHAAWVPSTEIRDI